MTHTLDTLPIKSRRQHAVEAATAAAETARLRGANLLVFGSLATGRFDERSDIDVAITPPDGDGMELILAVEDEIERRGFSCDVIDLRHASDSLRRKIERDGRAPDTLG